MLISKCQRNNSRNQISPRRQKSGPRRRGHRGGRGRRRPAPAVLNPNNHREQNHRRNKPSRQSDCAKRCRCAQRLQNQNFSPRGRARLNRRDEKFQAAPRRNDPDNSAISRAVNEVTDIVESLRQALEQMEEVLELVELAERQKTADEREIESLLRALRQFQSRGVRRNGANAKNNRNKAIKLAVSGNRFEMIGSRSIG